MDDRSDSRLLHDYAERRSDDAFAALVRRHIDLVHSAALRMVNDSHLAQDVTQNTFVALAKNATELKTRPVIAGWLHRTAQNIAAQTVRTDVRRRNREQEATAMNTLLSETPDASWHDIAPHLDIALGGLDEPDRDAVLLRYFEKKSAHEMAAQLGISDDAAQKRVSRAVERLREFFTKRGVTVGASGLAVVISANAVQAAPVGLALTISTAAALTGTTLATTATLTATKAIAMTALQKTIVTATIAVLAGAGIYEARQASQLREQVQTLQQQQAPLAEQIQKLQSERDDVTSKLTALRDDNERLNRETGELLKLRAVVTGLRQPVEKEAKPTSQVAPPLNTDTVQPASVEEQKDNPWADVGASTPEEALQTFLWAMTTNESNRVDRLFQWDVIGEKSSGLEDIMRMHVQTSLKYWATNIASLQIESSSTLDNGEIQLGLLAISKAGSNTKTQAKLRRIGSEWHLVGAIENLGESTPGLPSASVSMPFAPQGRRP